MLQSLQPQILIDSGASHSFVGESVVKVHWWLVASTEVISFCLATASEVVGLAEVKHGCPAWFGLLHPHLLLDTKGF